MEPKPVVGTLARVDVHGSMAADTRASSPCSRRHASSLKRRGCVLQAALKKIGSLNLFEWSTALHRRWCPHAPYIVAPVSSLLRL